MFSLITHKCKKFLSCFLLPLSVRTQKALGPGYVYRIGRHVWSSHWCKSYRSLTPLHWSPAMFISLIFRVLLWSKHASPSSEWSVCGSSSLCECGWMFGHVGLHRVPGWEQQVLGGRTSKRTPTSGTTGPTQRVTTVSALDWTHCYKCYCHSRIHQWKAAELFALSTIHVYKQSM